MHVKLCDRCPYTPRDLAQHYDPDATLYACATCDDKQYWCEARWRRECPAKTNYFGVRQSAAPSAMENSALFAIIAHETRSVRENASISSGSGATMTADGFGEFARLEAILDPLCSAK